MRSIVLTAAVVATVVATVVGGWHARPAIARLIAGTPDPLAAACALLGMDVRLAVLSGWTEVGAAVLQDAGQTYRCARTALVVLAGEQIAGEAIQADAMEDGAVDLAAAHGGVTYRASCRYAGAGDAGKLYLTCELRVQGPTPAGLGSSRRRVEAALHSLGPGARRPEPVMITVSGLIDGVLTASEARTCAGAVAGRLRGSLVDVIDGEGYCAALVYATMLGEAVFIGGRPVNLGLFFRPDPENGCTRVFVGTPLYTGDY